MVARFIVAGYQFPLRSKHSVNKLTIVAMKTFTKVDVCQIVVDNTPLY
ncbi:hypothetical protein QWZ16_19965 [Vibrio ostreicida]|uniref:Transposase n=1 Tax=Vibrio ostreicida TaxID=526588 RepID=A0ABT8C0K5_9VIBR|nr:hypothetical protein [Vibrio ostreicida]MDN3611873.1 hypothetical protein [Vibrio ostreicida]